MSAAAPVIPKNASPAMSATKNARCTSGHHINSSPPINNAGRPTANNPTAVALTDIPSMSNYIAARDFHEAGSEERDAQEKISEASVGGRNTSLVGC
jgi:hypothetical protein